MAKIQPTISFTSNSNSVTTNPGPGSVSIAASIADSLNVDLVEQRLITTSTTLNEDTTGKNGILADGYELMTAGGGSTWPNDGTVGSYIFMKNNSTTTGEMIYIAIVSNCDDNQATATGTNTPLVPDAGAQTGLSQTDNITLRTFTLLPGEFAWFPWDYTGRISFEAKTGNPKLEYWRWDKA